MNILHTSDWHLGRTLYGKHRYDEFAQFLDWLLACLQREQIDVLLVAGDIFDNPTPSHRAQELYYHFLYQVAQSSCRHVVITAGNHDSPTLLRAPKDMLRSMQVYVIGVAGQDVCDEVLVLHDSAGQPALIVCAAPYLRDRDVRTAEVGEDSAQKSQKYAAGINAYYARVTAHAQAQRTRLGVDLPIVAMGHLFVIGGKTVEGDGVRRLSANLGDVDLDCFSSAIDYLALGHLHIPQRLGDDDARRYCGSPIAMNFGEATQRKQVVKVTFSGRERCIQEIPTPCFQRLVSVRGDFDTIRQQLSQLIEENVSIWAEVVYQGQDIIATMEAQIRQMTQNTLVEVLRIKNRQLPKETLEFYAVRQQLEDMSALDVFTRCLHAKDVPPTQHAELIDAFEEILAGVQGHQA